MIEAQTPWAHYYTDWHSKASKAGYVPLQKPVIIKLLDRLSEEDVIQVAEEVSKDVMLLLRDENDLLSTLNLIETWVRVSGFPYRARVILERLEKQGNFVVTDNTIVLKVDVGKTGG